MPDHPEKQHGHFLSSEEVRELKEILGDLRSNAMPPILVPIRDREDQGTLTERLRDRASDFLNTVVIDLALLLQSGYRVARLGVDRLGSFAGDLTERVHPTDRAIGHVAVSPDIQVTPAEQ